jgi:hypothetical protein
LGQSRYFFIYLSETSGTLAVKLSDNGILPPYNQYKRAVTVKTLAIGVFVLPLLSRHHQCLQNIGFINQII